MGNDKIKLPELPVDPIRKKESLYKIQEAAAYKRLVYCPSWLEILKSQLSYISRGYWIGQGAFAGVGIVLFLLLGNLSREDAPYLFYASVLAASIGIVTVMELGRSQSFQMGELEESCYFNLGQLWAIKMIELGYKKVYCPFAPVYHSHNYPIGTNFSRYYDEYKGLYELHRYKLVEKWYHLPRYTWNHIRGDYHYLKSITLPRKEKVKWLIYSIRKNHCRYFGGYLAGRYADWSPKKQQRIDRLISQQYKQIHA